MATELAVIQGSGGAAGSNLARLLPPELAQKVVGPLDEAVRQAQNDRQAMLRMQAEGIKRMGIDRSVEARSEPFDGASVAVHPALMMGMVDFQAGASAEFCPPEGLVREAGDDSQRRLARLLNRQMVEQMPEWRREVDRMLMMLGLEGSSFLKVWYNPELARPVVSYVPTEQMILPYSCSGDPLDAPFVCHRLYETRGTVADFMRSGLWLEHDPSATTVLEQDQVRQEIDRVQGQAGPGTGDDRISGVHVYDECHAYCEIPGLGWGEWVVTWHRDTLKLVALRRNVGEDGRRKRVFAHFQMFPWKGCYGIGLMHAIGGLTDAATGSLRALLDGAQIQNMPGGMMLGDTRSSGEAVQYSPMRWNKVRAPAGVRDIREAVMPYPYNGPSPMLFQLLQFLTENSREFASVSMQRLAEATPETPVGTMMALVEGGARVFSAIHGRIHPAMVGMCHSVRQADRLMPPEDLASLVPDLRPEDLRPGNKIELMTRPAAPSQAHRMAMAQSGLALAEKGLQVGVQPNMRKALVDAGEAMGVRDVAELFPEAQPYHGDPYSETVQALRGMTLVMELADDHGQHVRAHVGALALSGVTQSQGGQALVMHALEHAAALGVTMGEQAWAMALEEIAGAIEPQDPTVMLAEVEREKTIAKQQEAMARVQVQMAQLEQQREEIVAKIEAQVRLEREQMEANIREAEAKHQLALDEIRAKLEAEITLTREKVASAERIAAAQIGARQQETETKAAADVEKAKEQAKARPKPAAKAKGKS